LLGATMGYSTKGTVSAALVTQDHKCGRVISKAFGLIGAVRLLANRVQNKIAEQSIDFIGGRLKGKSSLEPGRLWLEVYRFHLILPVCFS
jgi:hypothetical protein